MALTDKTLLDLDRIDALVEQQERIFLDRQPRSAELVKAAREALAGGATSSWQIARPQAVWMSHGVGSKVYDVDGNPYVDLHGGYGVSAVGHGHPAIVEAVAERVARGTHFAQPTEDSIAVAAELARRFGLPLWRFCNSGTEATMDAVHLMRAVTGRSLILKIEGCYHGHHDSVQVSVLNDFDEIGPEESPASVASSTGIPDEIVRLTLIVPFNDLGAMERRFEEHSGEIAGVILEPIMMNAGIIPPESGYLDGVVDLAHRHGALVAFDEVKTGVTVAAGGATELEGVTPDLVCLAKAMGGGLPCGAIGGSEEVMGAIVRGDYEQVGTFNGNPLTMAAARAALVDVLDADAYRHFARLRGAMEGGCDEVIDASSLPAYTVARGAKGCVTFSREPVRNYRDFLRVDDRFSYLHWLFQHNGGVFLPPWGKAEQWMLSVQHSAEDAQLFVDNFRSFAEAISS